MSSLAAFRVTSEIDLTGIATVFLAFATTWLAWWTRRAVAQGAVEVERAHRPVVVPLVDHTQSFVPWGGMALPLAPHLDERVLHVPIRNVGMGPALRIEAMAEFGDSEGRPSSSGMHSLTPVHSVAGVSADAQWVVLSLSDTPVTGMTGFVLHLSYGDVAGERWSTTARYSQPRDAYFDVKINAIDNRSGLARVS